MSEAQKPTTDAYRQNWKTIWGKREGFKDGFLYLDIDQDELDGGNDEAVIAAVKRFMEVKIQDQ